jgi:hypothetical protein
VVSRDITEGRGSATASIGRSIAVDLGITSSSSVWTNTDIAYDVALGGMPFIYAVSDERPYIRQTAPFNKPQFDNNQEPGEQSLTGWWIRSQSSFHSGTGIKFYDPSGGETTAHRFADSSNVNVWTKGEVTLLKETANLTGVTSGVYKLISIVDGSTDKILAWNTANTTINNYVPAGTAVTYTHAVTAGLDTATLAIATDGSHLFIADNDHIYTGPIDTPTAGYSQYYNTGSEKVVLAWVKQRLVAAIGRSIYELTAAKGSSHTLPTALYTHPNDNWTWTSISEGGSAIYIAGYAGTSGAIYKFTLNTAGVMPTLTSGIVAAQLPSGEYPRKIESYLGYLVIGTNKGIRVASISDTNGDLSYGPLIIEDNLGATAPRDFAFRDRFVYVTGSIGGCPGLYRIDLGNELETLRFAYAPDTFLSGVGGYATSVDFVGNSDQIAFTTSGSNGIAIQSTTVLAETGYIKTGKIRYGTLEPKNFKRLIARGSFTVGQTLLSSVVTNAGGTETEFDHIGYSSDVNPVEVITNQPEDAQEFLAYKFTLSRDATDTTLGPTFKGYQIKSTIATPRVRLIKFPVYCFDTETDKYNTLVGYEGRAFDRIRLLEDIEKTGDVITWQDLSIGESQQAVIEQVSFTRMTPPDRRFDGFGGIIEVTIRTV